MTGKSKKRKVLKAIFGAEMDMGDLIEIATKSESWAEVQKEISKKPTKLIWVDEVE